MSENVKQLKAALQLAEMHLEANPTDYNVVKVESAEREYQEALELEQVIEETLAEGSGQVAINGAGGQLVDLVQEQTEADKLRIQELEAALAEAKALLNQQANEKAEKIEEAEKSALSGEVPQNPAPDALAVSTVPATPVAAPAKLAAPAKPAPKPAPAKPANKAAAPAAEADLKKN